VAAVLLALVALPSLGLACGGAASSGVARLGTGTSTTASPGATATTLPPGASVQKHFQEALEFSRCMRAHRIPNFPDPNSAGGLEIKSSSGIDPGSALFKSAQKACRGYMPVPSAAQQARAEQQALQFAACMRAHGLANFPDPTFGPNGAIKENGSNDIDPNSAAFQAAMKICNS
jgi:hypothetical protein